MAPIETVLIANRGEIAVRILKTVSALGLKSVAVYSEADAHAPHVALADRAIPIGPPPVDKSYLDGARIIAAAKETGADAIHPGYGFLSENAGFAKAVADAGLVFIGPPVAAIELMGNKAAAKRRMIEAGVPCVPGYQGEDQSDAAMREAADEIGFPVMVKAAAGGGGRGMRLVTQGGDLADALKLARSEAENAFGSGELILEKAVLRPRHVEIQVFADAHGTVVHMGERDCSVQRRHQKVIEEAPSPAMTPALREAMGASAVEAARSIGYRGAGTVEFLLDGEGNFYFLEMNTRLQVEHPVTEMVTGLDLVALQIAVANSEPLGLAQDDIRLNGHAIEARLYAEDPAQGFLPATGDVRAWRPASGEGGRIDSGIRSGQAISPFYDPMIAKIVAHGPTRDIARRRLIEALDASVLFGLPTNKAFLVDCLRTASFANGEATTAFIAEEFPDGVAGGAVPSASLAAAAVLNYRLDAEAARARAVNVPVELMNWSSSTPLSTDYHYQAGDTETLARVSPTGRDAYRVMVGDEMIEVMVGAETPAGIALTVGGEPVHGVAEIPAPGHLDVQTDGRTWFMRNLVGISAAEEATSGGGMVTAPMHGRVVSVDVAVGDRVEPGRRLVTLEAMKMQHEIAAEIAGTVTAVHCAADAQVGADDLLVEIEADAPEEGEA